MVKNSSASGHSPRRRLGLLRDLVQPIKKDAERYEISPIDDSLSFEKGFFIVIRACQLLAQKNDGLVLVGVAGPSGAGKTVFTDKVVNFMPSIAVISMDNYNDSSRIVDGNFDDPLLTDYDTLLDNIHGLRAGKSVEVPIYDVKTSSRIGFRTLDIPSSRILIIEGIYALNEKLRPLLDLRVSITGGVHFDLVKRVLRDIQHAGQEPEEIIHQISETVYPMYKAYIEPDLQTAHIKIINKFNPFTGFQNPTYVLKSTSSITVEQIKAVVSNEYNEVKEETYDIYLLPPGEDPEACQSYLRMRNKDGKYDLMFEEWVTDSQFLISPRITFKVSVRLLGGLMALGYTIAAILKRSSHVFFNERVCVKIDWLEQLNRQYIQVQGTDRLYVKHVAEQLGLDGSYVPRTYIEQIQLEKLVNDVMTLPDDLRTKLSIDDDFGSSPKEALSRASADRRNKYLSRSFSSRRDKNLSVDVERFHASNPDSPSAHVNQGALIQLSEQLSTMNERADELASHIEELKSKISIAKYPSSYQNSSLQAEAFERNGPNSLLANGFGNDFLTGLPLPRPLSSSQLAKESLLTEEVLQMKHGQHQIIQQLSNLSSLLRQFREEAPQRDREEEVDNNARRAININPSSLQLVLSLAVGCLGVFLFQGALSRK